MKKTGINSGAFLMVIMLAWKVREVLNNKRIF